MRTPMASSRALSSSGQRSTPSGSSLSRAGNWRGSVMKQRAPARAAASAANAVGASVKCGCAPLRANSRIRQAGIAQLAAQLVQAAEQADARLDLEQQAIGRFDGHLRCKRGGDAGQPLHERQLARRIARPGVEIRRGRERRAQRHAGDALRPPAPWHPRR